MKPNLATTAKSDAYKNRGARLAGTQRTCVTVVVPMYNERECAALLADSLKALEQEFADRYDFEFLLVDDGSVDETVAVLEEWCLERSNYRVVKHGENRGIAAAIQTGIEEARYDIVASIDCDGSYDASLIGPMVDALQPGVALVTASPYHPAGGVANVPPWRLRISKLASSLYRLAVGEPLHCYTSCFRVYRREAARQAAPTSSGYVGVAELLWRVHRNGGQIVEFPAVLSKRVAGHSKIRVVRASCEHLRLMARAAASRVFIRRDGGHASSNDVIRSQTNRRGE